MQADKGVWMCVRCGHALGKVLGGELHPASGVSGRTSGPNFIVTCPECGQSKVWYTADPVVRAVYQLTDAVATVAAQSMITQVGKYIHTELEPELKEKSNP